MFISLLKTHHWSCLHLYMSTTTTHKFISRLKIHHWSCLHLYMTSRFLYFWVADFARRAGRGTLSSHSLRLFWIQVPRQNPRALPHIRDYMRFRRWKSVKSEYPYPSRTVSQISETPWNHMNESFRTKRLIHVEIENPLSGNFLISKLKRQKWINFNFRWINSLSEIGN